MKQFFTFLMLLFNCSTLKASEIDVSKCADNVPERFYSVVIGDENLDYELFSFGESPLRIFKKEDSAENIITHISTQKVNDRTVEILCFAPSVILFKIKAQASDLLNEALGFYVVEKGFYLKGPFFNQKMQVVIQADHSAK